MVGCVCVCGGRAKAQSPLQEESLTSQPVEAGVKGPQPSSHVTVTRVMLSHDCGSMGNGLL